MHKLADFYPHPMAFYKSIQVSPDSPSVKSAFSNYCFLHWANQLNMLKYYSSVLVPIEKSTRINSISLVTVLYSAAEMRLVTSMVLIDLIWNKLREIMGKLP